jgi:hypothetical protein
MQSTNLRTRNLLNFGPGVGHAVTLIKAIWPKVVAKVVGAVENLAPRGVRPASVAFK